MYGLMSALFVTRALIVHCAGTDSGFRWGRWPHPVACHTPAVVRRHKEREHSTVAAVVVEWVRPSVASPSAGAAAALEAHHRALVAVPRQLTASQVQELPELPASGPAEERHQMHRRWRPDRYPTEYQFVQRAAEPLQS